MKLWSELFAKHSTDPWTSHDDHPRSPKLAIDIHQTKVHQDRAPTVEIRATCPCRETDEGASRLDETDTLLDNSMRETPSIFDVSTGTPQLMT